MTNLFLEAAKDYASRNWPVHPLKPQSKMPNSPNGFKDATTDLELIEKWWSEHPNDNIGVATGLGLYVVDVDGPVGQQSLNDLVKEHGPLPETLIAQTGKGTHYFFFYDENETGGKLGNTTGRSGKLGLGIDTRGDGGFVVVSPSIHPSGASYSWLNEGTSLAQLPSWIVEAVRKVTWVKPTYSVSPYNTNLHPYTRRIFEASQERLWNAAPGFRNDELNREAFLMGGWIGSGSISRDMVENKFKDIALAKGLEPKEIMRTLASGIDKGMQLPTYVPDERRFDHDNINQQNARLAEGTINVQKGSSFGRSGVSFFWNKRIPVGKLTIFAGQNGIGKSFTTLALAAHATAGVPLLDATDTSLDGEVLFCSYEDDVEDSIGPRADLLGVDMERTHFITSVDTEHGPRDFGPQDVPRIIDYIKQCPEIKLVIIDPLGSFMGAGTDSNAENQMRAVLSTLTKAANETRAAIIMVAHRNKQSLDENPSPEDLVKSICGSQGIAAIARSVLMVERDKETDLRWVKHVKSNYSRLCPDISYTFDDDGFAWHKIRYSPADLAFWLKGVLKKNNGISRLTDLAFLAESQGKTEEDLKIAGEKLGVEIVNMEGQFLWKLRTV